MVNEDVMFVKLNGCGNFDHENALAFVVLPRLCVPRFSDSGSGRRDAGVGLLSI